MVGMSMHLTCSRIVPHKDLWLVCLTACKSYRVTMPCCWLFQSFTESHSLPLGTARHSWDIADEWKKSPQSLITGIPMRLMTSSRCWLSRFILLLNAGSSIWEQDKKSKAIEHTLGSLFQASLIFVFFLRKHRSINSVSITGFRRGLQSGWHFTQRDYFLL